MKGIFYFDPIENKYIVYVSVQGVQVNKFKYNTESEALNRVDLYKNCGVWNWRYPQDFREMATV